MSLAVGGVSAGAPPFRRVLVVGGIVCVGVIRLYSFQLSLPVSSFQYGMYRDKIASLEVESVELRAKRASVSERNELILLTEENAKLIKTSQGLIDRVNELEARDSVENQIKNIKGWLAVSSKPFMQSINRETDELKKFGETIDWLVSWLNYRRTRAT